MTYNQFTSRVAGFAKRHRLILMPLLAVFLIAFPHVVRDAYFLRVATVMGIYMILASSLNIIIGFTGMFSLGHAAFYGIGAYTSALLSTRLGVPFWLGLPAAAIVAGAFGSLLGLATLRLRAVFLAFATLGFGEIIRIIILNWRSFTRGPQGIPGVPIPKIFGYTFDRVGYYYLIVILVVLTVMAIQRLYHSRIGRALIALREDEVAAGSMGIHVFGYKMLAFTLACSIAGIAGAFFAHFQRFVSADSFVNLESFAVVTMVALGGTGSIAGPLYGAGILVLFPELFRFLARYRMVIYGLVLVTVIITKPGGIAGVRGIFEKPAGKRRARLWNRFLPRRKAGSVNTEREEVR